VSDALFDEITVHCVFCPVVVRALYPRTASDRMEEHYDTEHGEQIARIIDGLVP
jgi:hypothetical protein